MKRDQACAHCGSTAKVVTVIGAIGLTDAYCGACGVNWGRTKRPLDPPKRPAHEATPARTLRRVK
jgi:hypothetical protein